MKSAIIVGASSMLGRELARQLINEGIKVITAGRRPDSDIRIDMGSDQLPEFGRSYTVDVLFHCASAFGGDSPEGLREKCSRECRRLPANIGDCPRGRG